MCVRKQCKARTKYSGKRRCSRDAILGGYCIFHYAKNNGGEILIKKRRKNNEYEYIHSGDCSGMSVRRPL